MKIAEAKEIAANPGQHPNKLRLALLKLEVATLRAFPSSPRQKELGKLCEQIRAQPRELWEYVP